MQFSIGRHVTWNGTTHVISVDGIETGLLVKTLDEAIEIAELLNAIEEKE